MTRGGVAMIEVLVALSLVAIQVPAVVATSMAAAALTRQAESILAGLEGADLVARCHR